MLVKLLNIIYNILDDGKARGTIRQDIETSKISWFIQSVITGTINSWIVIDDVDLEEKMDYAMDCIWDYIKN